MWHAVARSSEIPSRCGRVFEAGAKRVAVFHAEGRFYAMDNACLHRGGPLAEGHLEGMNVTCPWHAWEFDLETGKCLTMEGAAQRTYPVKVEKGEVFVEI